MSRGKHIREHRDIGLYSYEQVKYVTPFQYLAQIAVGAFVTGMGGLLLYVVAGNRAKEIQTSGAAGSHFWGWLGGCSIAVIGIFMAHAGVIFYCRKIRRAIFRAGRGQRSSMKR